MTRSSIAEKPTQTTSKDVTVYQPFGASAELWKCRDGEILLDGPSGTGKTRACLEKAYLAAMKYPGARILLVRRTRASMTHSVLVTFEEKVLPIRSHLRGGPRREHRSSYVLPNGSEMVIGGLDKVERMMSTEYDMIIVFEATEVTEGDWETLQTRLRNGMMPYTQAIADCNPEGPTHWLKKRADRKIMTRIASKHEDNPTITKEYIKKLDGLTGHRKERLRFGKWVAAEGMIYDRWDAGTFIQSRDLSPQDWKRIVIAGDEGYTNPAAFLILCLDGDSRIHIAEEWYQRNKLPTEVVDVAKDLAKRWPEARFILDPSAAGLIADIRAAGLRISKADNAIHPGIQSVQKRFVVAGDGRPRITVDPSCRNFIEEVESYKWKPGKDEPIKENDHIMDCLRYGIMELDHQKGRLKLETL